MCKRRTADIQKRKSSPEPLYERGIWTAVWPGKVGNELRHTASSAVGVVLIFVKYRHGTAYLRPVTGLKIFGSVG